MWPRGAVTPEAVTRELSAPLSDDRSLPAQLEIRKMEDQNEAPKVCDNCERYPATHRHSFAYGVYSCFMFVCCNCANCDSSKCEPVAA